MSSIRTLTKISKADINVMSTGDNLIGTTEGNNQLFVPLYIVINVSNKSGTISTQPSISFGTNSTSYNNLITNGTPTYLDTLNRFNILPITAYYETSLDMINENTGIYMKVNTAATGSGSPVLRYDVHVFGFYHGYFAP